LNYYYIIVVVVVVVPWNWRYRYLRNADVYETTYYISLITFTQNHRNH